MKLWKFLFFYIFCYSSFALAGGAVKLEIGEKAFGVLLTEALQKIDGSLSAQFDFTRGSKEWSLVTYKLKIATYNLELDCLSDSEQGIELKQKMQKAARKLAAAGVQELEVHVPLKLNVSQKNKVLQAVLKVDFSGLKILGTGVATDGMNFLLDELKTVIVNNYQDQILAGVQQKYFSNSLKVGKMAEIEGGGLEKQQALRVNFFLGSVNALNPLSVKKISSTDKALLVYGVTQKGGEQ